MVDLARLERTSPRVAGWARDRRVPKVVVATQTRVLEAAVDVHGHWYPSVPTIAVAPELAWLWHVAAVLVAPPVSAWALERFGGAALRADALKLSARQVLELPMPGERSCWDEGAGLVRRLAGSADPAERAALRASAARAMAAAYAVDSPSLLAWWTDRCPRRDRGVPVRLPV
ncbi:MAG: hypothetical protein U5R31_15205 [Acidimicrobiia bacterium]|nr:hypothetical protein [Acidimicrobiia bacterium]